MHSSTIARVSSTTDDKGVTRQIIGFVCFTFACCLSIGLPIAVLPPYVHLRMGHSVVIAGVVISTQYLATLFSRPWAGRISDTMGAKVSVMAGVAGCTISGVLLMASAALYPAFHWLSFACLLASRLMLGVGQSLGTTGAILWGVSSLGQEHTAKVISYNGVAAYAAMAMAAPLGVVMEQKWGLASLGLLTAFVGAVSFVVASRKSPAPVLPGTHLPFGKVLGRVAPHGMALAMGGMGYSVLSTFITLYYASRHWGGAALCLTAFGLAFLLTRMSFASIINMRGGFPVAIVSLSIELLGPGMLWLATSPWMAFVGAVLTGLGFSLVYPSLGVEAVKRVSPQNRGTALAIFSACSDVSFFLTGPIAGLVIGAFGYPSAFLLATLGVLLSLGITIVLHHQTQRSASLL